MTESEMKICNEKLDKIINLLAASIILGKSQNEQILLLARAGFQPKDIAELIGSTPNAVRVFLSRKRRGK